jgi:hypothetical protein
MKQSSDCGVSPYNHKRHQLVKCDHLNVGLMSITTFDKEAISEFLDYRYNLNDIVLVVEVVSRETKYH